MKRSIGLAISLALAMTVILLLGKTATLRAKGGCSNASLQGSYGLHATGTLTGGPNAGPAAFVGVITFDGLGQLSLSLTQRLSSASGPITLMKVPLVGTYSVNADCTAEDVWHNMLNGTSSIHELIIVDHGRGFFILNTSTGGPNVVSGEARKQFEGDGEDRD